MSAVKRGHINSRKAGSVRLQKPRVEPSSEGRTKLRFPVSARPDLDWIELFMDRDLTPFIWPLEEPTIFADEFALTVEKAYVEENVAVLLQHVEATNRRFDERVAELRHQSEQNRDRAHVERRGQEEDVRRRIDALFPDE